MIITVEGLKNSLETNVPKLFMFIVEFIILFSKNIKKKIQKCLDQSVLNYDWHHP